MASDYRFTTYRASSTRATYENIMNSKSVQQEMLRRANMVAKAARAQRVDVTVDVRPTPGRNKAGRAHARVTAKRQDYTDTSDRQKSFAVRGHNLRIDRVLQAALDAARG